MKHEFPSGFKNSERVRNQKALENSRFPLEWPGGTAGKDGLNTGTLLGDVITRIESRFSIGFPPEPTRSAPENGDTRNQDARAGTQAFRLRPTRNV
jgi:hypothetical protein